MVGIGCGIRVAEIVVEDVFGVIDDGCFDNGAVVVLVGSLVIVLVVLVAVLLDFGLIGVVFAGTVTESKVWDDREVVLAAVPTTVTVRVTVDVYVAVVYAVT